MENLKGGASQRYSFKALTSPIPIHNSAVDTVSLDASLQATLDPWGLRMLERKEDLLMLFLHSTPPPQALSSKNKAAYSGKLPALASQQQILYPAANYTFVGKTSVENHHQNKNTDNVTSSLLVATDEAANKRKEAVATLDVFGQYITYNLDEIIHQWLESEAFVASGLPTRKIKITSLLRIFPEQRENILVGMSESKILAWLGQPDKSRRVGNVVTWQYVSKNCIVNVYLYNIEQIPLHIKRDFPADVLNSSTDRIASFTESYQLASTNLPCRG